jgi:RNA polymerase sigma-70 factor (ECF subfamily)
MTLLALHEKRHTYDPTARFMPWLVAVARHKLIDYVRKHKRHVHVELDEEIVSDDSTDTGLAARDVAALMVHLSPDQAEALRLHKLMDLSVDEVSAKTGKSTSSVKVLVHRGLKKLQLLVGQEDVRGGGL